MKYRKQWLSELIYEALPFVFFIAAIALWQITESVFVKLFAIYLFGYAAYIFAWRVMARDCVLVDSRGSILKIANPTT